MTSVHLYVVFHLIGSLIGIGYEWQLYALYNKNYRKELLNRIAVSFLLGIFLSWIIVGIGFFNVANNRKHNATQNKNKKDTKRKIQGDSSG